MNRSDQHRDNEGDAYENEPTLLHFKALQEGKISRNQSGVSIAE